VNQRPQDYAPFGIRLDREDSCHRCVFRAILGQAADRGDSRGNPWCCGFSACQGSETSARKQTKTGGTQKISVPRCTRLHTHSIALTMSSTTFFASPNTIIVLSM
jgi:hypothetical protein